jgi:hypothetical protein
LFFAIVLFLFIFMAHRLWTSGLVAVQHELYAAQQERSQGQFAALQQKVDSGVSPLFREAPHQSLTLRKCR